jgi:type II secretory pathway component GspD/PulD (secretin)
MIEANLVEVILSEEFQMGIDWTLVADIAGDLQGGIVGGVLAAQTLAPSTGLFRFSVTDNSNVSVLLDARSV